MSVPITKGGVKTVAAGATNVTITFATDDQLAGTPLAFPTGYTVVVTCVVQKTTNSWATSIQLDDAPSLTSVQVNFGTAAPAYGGNLHWLAQGYKT